MPEWAEAAYVLVGTIAAVVAYRYGAAAASEERRDASTHVGRLLTSGARAATAAGIGTIAADGSAPTATTLLFAVAGIALVCGFALRLGVRLSGRGIRGASGGPTLPERLGKAALASFVTATFAFFTTGAVDSGSEAPPAPATPVPTVSDSE